jgi:hypothetical protein
MEGLTGYELRDKYGGTRAIHEKYLDWLLLKAKPFDKDDIDHVAERAISQSLLLVFQVERLIKKLDETRHSQP